MRKDGASVATQINVNGTAYDSVGAMPPDVRKLYEETIAQFPDLADDGNGVPQIIQKQAGPVQFRATVRNRFIVNGTTYENEADMPSDVRRVFQQAMSDGRAAHPAAKKNEIKLSFQLTGPRFSFKPSRAPSPRPGQPMVIDAPKSMTPPPTPTPIEPAPVEGRLRLAIILGACVALAFLVWALANGR